MVKQVVDVGADLHLPAFAESEIFMHAKIHAPGSRTHNIFLLATGYIHNLRRLNAK